MNFENALKGIKRGKKARVVRLSTNYIFLEGSQFYVFDGLYTLPIGNIRAEYILAQDWEFVE